MHTLDQISQRTAVLPDNLQQEVLDFVEFLVAKSHSFIHHTQNRSNIAAYCGLTKG